MFVYNSSFVNLMALFPALFMGAIVLTNTIFGVSGAPGAC